MNESLSIKDKSILLITLLLISAFQSMESSITNLAMNYISGSISQSPNYTAWINTFYTIGNLIGYQLINYLCLRFGQVLMLIIAITSFLFSSLLIGSIENLELMLPARFIQGATSAFTLVLSIRILVRLFSSESKPMLVGAFFTLSLISPIIGPYVGGAIAEYLNWRIIFLMNIPICLIGLILILPILKNRESIKEQPNLDLIGVIFLSIFIICIKIVVDKGEQWDWYKNQAINLLSTICVISFTFLVQREKTCKSPIVVLSLFKRARFLAGCFMTFIGYFAIYGAIVLVPQLLFTHFHYVASDAGLVILPASIVPILFFYPIQSLVQKYHVNWLIFLFFMGMALSFFFLSFFTAQIDFSWVAISFFILGIPFSLFLPTLFDFTLKAIEEESYTAAFALYLTFKTFSSGIAGSLASYLWSRREFFHRYELLGYNNYMGPGNLLSLTLFDQSLRMQTAILAINDVLRLFSWILLGSSFIILLFEKKKRSIEAGAL